MKKSILLIGLFAMMYTSCKTFDGSKRDLNIPFQLKDVTVIGYVRIEGKNRNKSTSYDALLSEARRKYNNDKVDVVNINVDSYKGGTKKIMNGLVILYVDKKPVAGSVK